MTFINIFVLFSIIFLIGLFGVFLNRKNIITIVLSLELILLAINTNLIVVSINHDDILGQLLSILVLTIASAETSIGLAILITNYRIHGSVSVNSINMMVL